MGLFSRAKPNSSLVASAAKLKQADSLARPNIAKSWQTEAFNLCRAVGEMNYALTFIGDTVSRVGLSIGIKDQYGDIRSVDEGDNASIVADAEAAVEDLRAQIGGQPQLLRALAENLSITGEVYLVANETDDGLYWEALSVSELAQESGRFKRIRYPSDTGERLPEDNVPLRIWRADRQWSNDATSMVQAVMPTLRKIVLLDAEDAAMAQSRISAGALIMPNEVTFPPLPGDSPEADSFLIDLVEHLTTPIRDPSSASAVVPFVVRVPYDYADRIRTLDFARTDESNAIGAKRQQAIEQLARGVQLPVEIVLGVGSSNHWSGWLIDETLVKSHIAPLLEIIVDGLTIGYLRSRLELAGYSADEISPYVIVPETSALVVHPNRNADALLLYDRAELAGAAVRRYSGFPEGDAPDDEELERRRELKEIVAAPKQATAGGAGAVETAPPPGASLRDRLAAAVEVSVDRAVERAGSRLRSKAASNQALRDTLASVGNAHVASTLGPSMVASLAPEDDLFVAEFASLGRAAAKWAAEQDAGVFPSVVASAVMGVALGLAKARLYDPAAQLNPADLDFSIETAHD